MRIGIQRNGTDFITGLIGGSIYTHRLDLKTGVRQSFDDTFRNLFGFLGFYSAIWMILASVDNCGCNYRIHLMLIGHRSTLHFTGNKQLVARLKIQV
jgi:hypothetical protein